ncbi:hypothetical protein [Pararhizobium haloflavum]|uniref:hypothetical protein n=1 Tax=Pararhizobium haloflavum TaxID=2037914 RepID=UPI000C19E37E|nr:hypothetical protein [Pararhizobium haloflavum]
MKRVELIRIAATVAAFGAGTMVLSGCMGSPTYGTDQTAAEQLLDDLSSAASIRTPQGADIEYQPRPDLVTPPDNAQLPPPQPSVASSEQWPESPEETRDRLRAEADLSGGQAAGLNAPRTGYTGSRAYPPVVGGGADGPPPPGSQDTRESQERYRAAQEVARGSNPTRRNFLSEPPLDYRRPAETAPVGDFGETERSKERRRERLAERPGNERRWWPF